MRVIDRIATPWCPYAVTFSHDGTRLAIGGGSWYGFGGISLIDLRTKERVDSLLGDLDPRAFQDTQLIERVAAIAGSSLQGGSVSSLAFSSDDRHLMVSSWTSSQHDGPILVFEVEGLTLRPAAMHEPPGTVTGIHAHGPGAVLRIWDAAAEATLDVLQWPASLAIDRTRGRPELTNHRLVVAHGHAITGNHGANSAAPQPGLILRSLANAERSFVATGDASLTAINATVGGTLITGDAEGRLAAFAWSNTRPIHDHVIGDLLTPRPSDLDTTLWATYQPSAVVGICSMSNGRAVAVTAGGMLGTWRSGKPITSWPLPVSGSPRTIAASPDRSLIAVGVKQGHAPSPDAMVVLIEIEPDTLAGPWRTPRTRQMAIAADAQRTPTGTLDPITLGVLADALEEAGCRPRVLHHLRTHDRRLRTCWVLDELRE